jgi:hypothetical protein
MKEKKNNTKQSVAWPTSTYFTIKQLASENSEFIEITLRVRLTNEIESGRIAEIGSRPGGKGRPEKVFAFTPITQTTLNKARTDKINLVDNADRLVNIVAVSPSQATVTTSQSSLVAH